MTAERNTELTEAMATVVGTAPAPQPENLDAAFGLPTESYQQFMARFRSLQSQGTSSASVEDELRARGIDPDIFYGSHGRPGIAAPPEEGDGPAAPAPPMTNGTSNTNRDVSAASVATAARAGSGLRSGFLSNGARLSANTYAPPPRELANPDDGPLGEDIPDDDPRWGDLGWASRTGLGQEDLDALRDSGILTDADEYARFQRRWPGREFPQEDCPTINVPDDDELPCVELEVGEAAGRMGRETPGDLGGKLQIDNLTDCDSEEDMLRIDDLDDEDPGPAQDNVVGDGEDAVEAFTLDEDFDYDNIPLTQKFTRPES